MKKISFYISILLLISGLTAGCAPQREEGTVIRVADFLTDPILIQILNENIQNLEKQNPGVKIKLETTPYNDYQQKIVTQISANSAPDILYVEVNNFVDLYLRGVLDDLDPYLQKDGIDLKTYYPGVIGRFSPNGHLFALPQDTAPQGLMYYNKKVFDEVGVPYPTSDWSWPEPFLSICKKLTRKDARGKVNRWAYCDAYPVNFENFLFSAGGNWVDDPAHPARFTADSPEALQAARFRYDLIHKYHASPSPSEIQAFNFGSGVEQMFINGQVAMMDSGIWHTPQLLKAKDLKFDVVEFPKGPTGLRAWGTGGSGYALCRSSKNKEMAWKIIKELTNEAFLTRMSSTGMIQPALIKLAESDAFLKAPGPANRAILLKMPEYSHYEPFIASWGEIYYGNLGPALDPVWIGDKTPEQVLPAVTKLINQKFFKAK